MALVKVRRVTIPAMSSVGYGYGEVVECGTPITFVGDHRPMREIGEALGWGEEIKVEVEPWQVLKLGTPEGRC